MNESIIEELERVGSITNGNAILTVDQNGYHFRDARNIIGGLRHDISLDSNAERVEAHWNGFLENMRKVGRVVIAAAC